MRILPLPMWYRKTSIKLNSVKHTLNKQSNIQKKKVFLIDASKKGFACLIFTFGKQIGHFFNSCKNYRHPFSYEPTILGF